MIRFPRKMLSLGVVCAVCSVSLSTNVMAASNNTYIPALSQPSDSLQASDFDPWLKKPVLSYLFNTQDSKLQNDLASLKQTLSLSDEQWASLKQAANLESFVMNQLNNDSDQLLSTKTGLVEKQQAIRESSFNDKLNQALQNTDATAHEVLKDKYPQFRNWLYTWWNNERKYRNASVIQPSVVSGGGGGTYYSIYATQYNANTTYEVALPDKYLKYSYYGQSRPSNYNGQYSVTIDLNGTYSTQYVKEVGPWNEDDNYWDPNYDRREFFDLSQYTPESYAAFENNYNGGLDQFGRTVTNPAGIDLSPAVASTLGMGPGVSSWVMVNFVGLP